MLKEPKPMREIHQIQEKLHDGERKLSPRLRIRKLHREAAAIMRKYGLRTKAGSKV